jgi:hypothetical protein
METNIIINDRKIPISWENEIGIGVILCVSAPSLINAATAVQFFLNQMGHRHLWYSNEVKSKSGIFQFEIVEVQEAEAYNCN